MDHYSKRYSYIFSLGYTPKTYCRSGSLFQEVLLQIFLQIMENSEKVAVDHYSKRYSYINKEFVMPTYLSQWIIIPRGTPTKKLQTKMEIHFVAVDHYSKRYSYFLIKLIEDAWGKCRSGSLFQEVLLHFCLTPSERFSRRSGSLFQEVLLLL